MLNVHTLETLLARARALKASDLHLSAGAAPVVRCNGLLRPLSVDGEGQMKLTQTQLEEYILLLPDSVQEELYSYGEADCALTDAVGGRCRVNVYRQNGGVAFAIRLLQASVPCCSELALPKSVQKFAELHNGLVLFAGATGSGKSTTMAALINKINQEQAVHIITLEDPVEYTYPTAKAFISQRQVGRDTCSFASGLRSALREDPDVILVGELRDAETMVTALAAAETGHLVFATLHTASAASTINRILDTLPDNQIQLRSQLADTLQGVICQQLLPRADERGMVAAFEVLVAHPSLRTLIREGRTHQLDSYIQTGSRFGMQTLSESMDALRKQGIIK